MNNCQHCNKPLRKFHKKGFKPQRTHLKCYKIWKINQDLKNNIVKPKQNKNEWLANHKYMMSQLKNI